MNSTMIKSVSNIGSPWGLHAPLVLSSHPRASTFERMSTMEIPSTARPIKKLSSYRVDRDGSVYSLPNQQHRFPLKLTSRDKYRKCGSPQSVTVTLKEDRTRYISRSVHRLVADAFLPNPNKLPIVMHLNDNPFDNRVENLKWGTQKDNIQDAIKKNRLAINEKNPKCILLCLDVIVIVVLREMGFSFAEIARRFRVNRRTVSGIIKYNRRERITKHIPRTGQEV
jgi:hypothetical protein